MGENPINIYPMNENTINVTPLFLKGVDYAQNQQAIQNISISIFCLLFFISFVIVSFCLIAFYISPYSNFTVDSMIVTAPLRTQLKFFYLILSLVTCFTLFLGALFGQADFHFFFLVILFVPFYGVFCYFFDPERYIIFTFSYCPSEAAPRHYVPDKESGSSRV